MDTNIAQENLSQHTQKIIEYALGAAKKNGADLVGTEYILLGLLDLNDEVLSKILKQLGANVDDIKEYVHYNLSGTGKPTKKDPSFSPRTKRVLDIAQEERMTLKHRYVEGEHLLLGLIKEGEGMGFQILKRFGINHDAAEAAVREMVGEGKEEDTMGHVATPLLDKFGQDFSNLAREGKLDPVIGRVEEIERMMRILSRRRKNNPVLVGEPGVGKTAIVEGLAYRMTTGDIPEVLKGKRIIGLSLMSLMAGATKRGEFEERLQNALKEAKSTNGEVILFFDEIHTLISSDSSTDVANILKPVLARGEVQFVGATTTNEYHKYIEKDQALERRFQPVTVPEPSEEDTFKILKGIRDKYEAYHRVVIEDDILLEAIKLSNKYIADRFQPDKSIDLIDESAAATRLPSFSAPKKVQEMESKLENLEKELEAAKRNNFTEEVEHLTSQLEDERKKLEEMQEEATQEKAKQNDTIAPETLKEIISKWAGVPLTHIRESESERLLKMEEYMHKRLIGQNEAVKLVSQAIRRGRAGLKKANKPIGSFLFMGPTGVGKTELAKTLAEYLFGTEEAMIRFDMSEYMEKHAYFRLIGAPPGYVGYEEGGQLTEAVRKKPFSVVLFDEIEKAHKDIFNLFLQMFDDGRLTDSKGHVVSFKNTIIICTSNVGSEKIQKKLAELRASQQAMKQAGSQTTKNADEEETAATEGKATQKETEAPTETEQPAEEAINQNPENLPAVVQEKNKELSTTVLPNEGELSDNEAQNTAAHGAGTQDDGTQGDDAAQQDDQQDQMKATFLKQLKKDLIEDLKEFLRPEMINRFDELIIFESLTQEDIIKIVDIMMKETYANLKDQNMLMQLTQAAKDRLGKLGYDPMFGARPLKRAIQVHLDTPLSDLLIGGNFQKDDKILCDFNGKEFTFTKVDSFGSDIATPDKETSNAAPLDTRLEADANEEEKETGTEELEEPMNEENEETDEAETVNTDDTSEEQKAEAQSEAVAESEETASEEVSSEAFQEKEKKADNEKRAVRVPPKLKRKQDETVEAGEEASE